LTLLHQHQREVMTTDVGGVEVTYLQATEDDVALGISLAAQLLMRDGDRLSPATPSSTRCGRAPCRSAGRSDWQRHATDRDHPTPDSRATRLVRQDGPYRHRSPGGARVPCRQHRGPGTPADLSLSGIDWTGWPNGRASWPTEWPGSPCRWANSAPSFTSTK
jgi:hypothetical protein